MKWNRKTKQTATATSALLIALLLSACTSNANVQNPIQTEHVEQQEQIDKDAQSEQQNDTDESNEQPDSTTDSVQNSNHSNENTGNDAVQETHSVVGTYVGAIDGHSIEVEVDGNIVVFQIDESFQHVIHEYKENSNVKIEYKEIKLEDSQYTQNWISSIEIVS